MRLQADLATFMTMNTRTLAILVLPIAILISACSPWSPTSPSSRATSGPAGSPQRSASSTTRTSDGGEVTVVVDWTGPTNGPVFDVTLDTHSMDLDALDLADATLRNDRGETLKPQPWAAPKGGHHRAGALTFAGAAGPFFAGARWIELVLPGVGGIPERTLRWELGA